MGVVLSIGQGEFRLPEKGLRYTPTEVRASSWESLGELRQAPTVVVLLPSQRPVLQAVAQAAGRCPGAEIILLLETQEDAGEVGLTLARSPDVPRETWLVRHHDAVSLAVALNGAHDRRFEVEDSTDLLPRAWDFLEVHRDSLALLPEDPVRAWLVPTEPGARSYQEMALTQGRWSSYLGRLAHDCRAFFSVGGSLSQAVQSGLIFLHDCYSLAPDPDQAGELRVLTARLTETCLMVRSTSEALDAYKERLSESRLRLAVEAAPGGVIMTDRRGKIVLVNGHTEVLFGYSRDELLLSTVDRLVGGGAAKLHARHREDFFRAPSPRPMGAGRSLLGRRKDGSEFPLEIGLTPIDTVEGRMVLAVVIDITERHQAREALEHSLEALKRSNADLAQFAYVASHDLQEPLRMVASFTQLLLERYRGRLDERADRYLNFAHEGAVRMQQLVSALLSYSRLDTAAREPVLVDSKEALDRVLRGLDTAVQECGATVTVGHLPQVRFEPGRLAMVFQHLISNALKFRGSRPPVVEVGCSIDRTEARFHVRDNGIGIDKDHAGRIFQMFQRLHERGQFPGSGVGLAVVKKVVERHGGRVWFESEPGKGSTFLFTVPGCQSTQRRPVDTFAGLPPDVTRPQESSRHER